MKIMLRITSAFNLLLVVLAIICTIIAAIDKCALIFAIGILMVLVSTFLAVLMLVLSDYKEDK